MGPTIYEVFTLVNYQNSEKIMVFHEINTIR